MLYAINRLELPNLDPTPTFLQDWPRHNMRPFVLLTRRRRQRTTKRMSPRQESSLTTPSSILNVELTLARLGIRISTRDTEWQRPSTTGPDSSQTLKDGSPNKLLVVIMQLHAMPVVSPDWRTCRPLFYKSWLRVGRFWLLYCLGFKSKHY